MIPGRDLCRQYRRHRSDKGKGKGGTYLVLPPGYDGDVPDGYFLLKPPTNRNFLFLRGFIKDGLEPVCQSRSSLHGQHRCLSQKGQAEFG
ncbi:DUF1254 domain-containing protein [Mesorhizobium sp.]|uniref:DUF1254 domain-containing protein n=1 Tax=Mesorhizobium sp. TaxID=1871066 RepID=UPI0025800803|nr:DUF1254 domain-containing protein [Mesorhizobium sp.]